jgi:hypothetical protein
MLQHIWLMLTFRHSGQGLRNTPIPFIVLIVIAALAVDALRWGVIVAEPYSTASDWFGWAVVNALIFAILKIGHKLNPRAIFAGWYMLTATVDLMSMMMSTAAPMLYSVSVFAIYEVAVTLTFLFRTAHASSVDSSR